LEKLDWRIYYDDDSTWDNLSGDPGEVTIVVPKAWFQAPSDGVLAIQRRTVPPCLVKRQIHHRTDNYFLHDDVLAGTDDLGPLLRKLGLVKFGRWTKSEHWHKKWDQIIDDPDFPSGRWEDKTK
jgi:hypothetical protein